MADVFISYKSERRPAARHLASIIEAHGFSVWFDYELVPGKSFGKAIEAELRQAKAAVVLWCSMSVQSEWVQDEADLAKKLGVFVPARIETCDPPLGFRRDDFVDISSWDGDPSTRSLDRLIDRIETLVGRESVIARRKLVELHQSWATLGRPSLAQFALGVTRDIAAEDRRLPSTAIEAAAPAPSPSTVSKGHDYAFWERQWDKHAGSDNLVALRVIVEEAPRYFAEQAKARIAEIDEQRRPKPVSQMVNRILSGKLTVGQLFFEQAQAAEGRIKVDAKIIHGAPADPAGGGWFLPGAGKTEWFKDLDAGPEMVVVPDAFAIGRFALTFAEWDAAQAHPEWRKHAEIEPRKPNDYGWGRGKQPAIDVSWNDAKAYCAWLSGVTGKIYRLPSEAEWEQACRAGSKTEFWWGNEISTAQANYDGNYTLGNGKKGEYRQRTVPVDSFEANPWGLYQVHGNVSEWCEDGYDPKSRFLRGGHYGNDPRFLRSANRFWSRLDARMAVFGFRVARTL